MTSKPTNLPQWLSDSEDQSDHSTNYFIQAMLIAAVFYPLLYMAVQALSGQSFDHLRSCLVVSAACAVGAGCSAALRSRKNAAVIFYLLSACVLTWDCFALCDESNASTIFVTGTLLAIAAYAHSMPSLRSLSAYVPFVCFCAGYRLLHSIDLGKDGPIFLIQIAGAATAFPQLIDKRRVVRKLALADERMRLLFRNAAAGISHVDNDLTIVSSNERFAEMLGYTVETLVGKRLDDITPLEERSARRSHFDEFLASPSQESTVDRSYLKADGTLAWLRLVIRKLDTARHGLRGTVAVSIDIGKERALMARRDSQKKLLENLAVSASLKDFAATICREAEAQIPSIRCNVTRIDADGKRLVSVGSFSMPEGFLEAISEGIPISSVGGPCSAAAAREDVVCVTDAPSDPLWLPLAPLADRYGIKACWSIPAKNSKGRTVGLMSCYCDQSALPTESERDFLEEQAALVALALERNDLLERLLRQQSQVGASAKMAALGAMAGEIAHEIRNPLAVIDVKAQRLAFAAEAASLPQKTQDDAQTIQRMVLRMLKTIEGLLVYSRESKPNAFEVVSFDALVQQTLDLCRERLDTCGIDVQYAVAVDVQIECHETQLSQVLLNLLNNACDAIAKNQQKWIRVEANTLEDSLELAVTDSGSGLPPEVAERMFEPFFTTKPKGQGTGIGLSVSRDIILAHGGTLSIDPSSPNTRFVVRLPKQQILVNPGAAARSEAA